MKLYHKKWYNKHKNKLLKKMKKYYIKNKETLTSYKAMWYKTNNTYLKKKSNKYYYNNKNAVKNTELKSKYGITLVDYYKLLKFQNNKCAICKIDKENCTNSLGVDHCHKTGKIRGLLCNNCNRALGHFHDNINNLNKAILYLKKT